MQLQAIHSIKNSAGALKVLMVFRAHPLWCLNFEPVAHQQGSPYPLGHSLPEIKKTCFLIKIYAANALDNMQTLNVQI